MTPQRIVDSMGDKTVMVTTEMLRKLARQMATNAVEEMRKLNERRPFESN
jgi:hypothetical protein